MEKFPPFSVSMKTPWNGMERITRIQLLYLVPRPIGGSFVTPGVTLAPEIDMFSQPTFVELD